MSHHEELPGTIFEFTNPSGQKVFKVELIVGHHANGRKKTIRRTAHSFREAQRLQLKLADDLERGLLGSTELKRMDEFAHWWIREVKARKVRKATAADYEYRYKAHVQPTFGRRQLASVTSRGLMQVLVTVLVTRPGRPVLPSWSRIRLASNDPGRLDVVSDDISSQSRPRSLTAAALW